MRREDACRGGGHVYIKDNGANVEAPQHDIDVAIVHAAYARAERMRRAAGAKGDMVSLKYVSITRRIAMDCGRDLSRSPYQTLPPNTRALFLKFLGREREQVLERVKDMTHSGDQPECLRPENLPKKPPPRRVIDA